MHLAWNRLPMSTDRTELRMSAGHVRRKNILAPWYWIRNHERRLRMSERRRML